MVILAEFCFDCLEKQGQEDNQPMKREDFIISKDLDLCEDCGEMKPVVIRYKRRLIIAERLREFFQRR